jgi:acyl carrier protein
MSYQISGPAPDPDAAEPFDGAPTDTVSTDPASIPTVPTVEDLTAWLIARVAVYLQRDPEEIDPREPLAEYGLDSVASLSLCGDVEEDFDVILDPTAAWDYPTATAFAEHLFKELTSAAGRP